MWMWNIYTKIVCTLIASYNFFIYFWASKLTVRQLILSCSQETIKVQKPDNEVNGQRFIYASNMFIKTHATGKGQVEDIDW